MVDNYDITTGGANYGADITIPGMKIAVVARAPVYRGKVRSFDGSEALKVQGVEQVVEIPALPDDKPAEFRALGGVAVVGTNTWSVMEGRRKLKIDWDPGPNAAHDSSTYDDQLRASARKGGVVIREGEMWLCSRMLPHRPQRPADTIGLIVEFPRVVDGKTYDDTLRWYCENCDTLVHQAIFRLAHIDEDLHKIMGDFWNGPVEGRTCKKCHEVIERAGEFHLAES